MERKIYFLTVYTRPPLQCSTAFAICSLCSFLQMYFFTTFTVESCYFSRVIRLGLQFSPSIKHRIKWAMSVRAKYEHQEDLKQPLHLLW